MKTYKIISMYDASTKRSKSVLLKMENFKDENEMKEHIKKIKEDQKIKNNVYKELIKSGVMPIKNVRDNAINMQNTLHLKLDGGTGNTTLILGSSKRGKTSLMLYIYKNFYMHDKDFITTLFSINSHIPEYNIDKNILKTNCFNKTSEKYIKLEKYINHKCKNKYKFLNIFDDIIDLKFKKLVNELILTYRNSNMSTILLMQYLYGVSKMMRSNINNIIIFGVNSDEAAQDLIKTYLKPYFMKLGYRTYEEQIKLFKDVTDNHGFFYIHPLSDSISFHRLQF